MSNWITPERIAKMQKWLLEHPIDHKYDEMCDMLDSPAPLLPIFQEVHYGYYSSYHSDDPRAA